MSTLGGSRSALLLIASWGVEVEALDAALDDDLIAEDAPDLESFSFDDQDSVAGANANPGRRVLQNALVIADLHLHIADQSHPRNVKDDVLRHLKRLRQRSDKALDSAPSPGLERHRTPLPHP